MSDTVLDTRAREKTARPRQFVVRFHNDDFTPMDFVIEILVGIFNMTVDEATALMLEFHKTGSGVVGPYTHEIAETRATQAMNAAKKFEFPFRCDVQPG